jgi:carboxyl-terminal processing protease
MSTFRYSVFALWAATTTLAPADSRDFKSRGDEIVGIVHENFYSRIAADEWASRHAGYADAIDKEVDFVARTKSVLADLKASHTAYYTRREPEFYGLAAIFASVQGKPPIEIESIGLDVTADGFVRTAFAGGPADKAGLKRGDRIVNADGREFQPVDSLRGRAGKPVTLLVQRERHAKPLAMEVTPRLIDPKREWLDAQREGTRVIKHNGKSVGYVPIFSGSGQEYRQLLRELIRDRLAAADALIVDFRNGWGGCRPDFIDFLDPNPAVLTMIDRRGKRVSNDGQWRKPFILLVNGGSRSGKEVVAHSVKKHKLGTLVGERTAGAVVGGRAFPLSDGSLLYLAVMDAEVDGERIEGNGVEPDIIVSDELPFAKGADPQLEKALDVAAGPLS